MIRQYSIRSSYMRIQPAVIIAVPLNVDAMPGFEFIYTSQSHYDRNGPKITCTALYRTELMAVQPKSPSVELWRPANPGWSRSQQNFVESSSDTESSQNI